MNDGMTVRTKAVVSRRSIADLDVEDDEVPRVIFAKICLKLLCFDLLVGKVVIIR